MVKERLNTIQNGMFKNNKIINTTRNLSTNYQTISGERQIKTQNTEPQKFLRKIAETTTHKISTIKTNLRKGNKIHSLRLDTWNKSANG